MGTISLGLNELEATLKIYTACYWIWGRIRDIQLVDAPPSLLVRIAAVPVPGVRPVFFLAASSCFSASMFLTYDSMSSTGSISMIFPGAIMAISMFFAPVWTTSNNDLTASLTVSSRSISSLWFRSKNSRTVLLDLPIALAFLLNVSRQAEPQDLQLTIALPSGIDAWRFGLIESRRFVSFVKPNNQSTNSEWPYTSTLCVSLLYASNIFCNVFNCDRVLNRQTMWLCL